MIQNLTDSFSKSVFSSLVVVLLIASFRPNDSLATPVSYDNLSNFTASHPALSLDTLETDPIKNQTSLRFDDFTVQSTLARLSIVDRDKADRRATSGTDYIKIGSGVLDVHFNFTDPIHAFGVWVSGWGQKNRSGTMSIQLGNGTDAVELAQSAEIQGDLFFFGISSDTAFSNLTLQQTRGRDAWALDDVYYGANLARSASASPDPSTVDEPSLFALLLLSLIALASILTVRQSRGGVQQGH